MEINVQRYCVGFAFDNCGMVALIRKNRPDWQLGKLNGIGGHTEPGETVLRSMVREFEEESGLLIPEDNWTLFAKLQGNQSLIGVFKTRHENLGDLRTMTDEQIEIVDGSELPGDVVPNLKWLIPLALDGSTKLTTAMFY